MSILFEDSEIIYLRGSEPMSTMCLPLLDRAAGTNSNPSLPLSKRFILVMVMGDLESIPGTVGLVWEHSPIIQVTTHTPLFHSAFGH